MISAIGNANQTFFSGHEVRSKKYVGRSDRATSELLFAYNNREEYGAIADAIRSGANTKSEDSKSTNNIMIDLELAREFLKGFAQGAPGMLTKKEIELLPLAIKIIPIELGMRYLTDYFDGDVYFGIVNEDDNYNRAKVQFALANDINEHMDEITKIVNEVFA